MNYIDIIISILVLLAAFKGFSRGIIKEVISLISLIIGVYIAIHFSVIAERYLKDNFPKQEDYTSFISFILVFLIVFFTLKITGILISKLVKSLQLGLLNKILGLVFGGAKVLIIISIILFEVNHVSESFGTIIPKNHKTNSLFYHPIINLIPIITPIAKQKYKELKQEYQFNDSIPK